ncbi:unnamed protein product [Rotaria sp. Silwood1]|nr:unnamed protein product [Rotaria sp. Silwood1]CAF1671271.1 unnamed protein product [Rotaria sp. Silwood1]CAF3470931.1 unnamed protein product [Rotaria sp. Silwood1]CAF3861889.1 unnamed protein product [Rotaria sp. Silwood1]CAF4529987.1 unnamed protein product [Rotaria sp. Silwood1]
MDVCAKSFPEANNMSETVADIVYRFEENGAVADKKRLGQPAVVRTAKNKAAVKSAFFSKDSTTSTRHATFMLDIPKTSIVFILSDF